MFLHVSAIMFGVSSHDLERLGHLIVSRRVALGFRQRVEFAAAVEITDRTMADIEKGVRKASAGTYAMIENRLGWKSGSIAAILSDGAEPELDIGHENNHADQPSSDTPYNQPLQHYSTDQLAQIASEALSEIRRRIIDSSPGQHSQGSAWGGLNPGSHWPEDNGDSENLGER